MSLIETALKNTMKSIPQVAVDGLNDPMWTQTNAFNEPQNSTGRVATRPAEELLTLSQKRAAWIKTPKGFFIVDVAVRDAYRNGFRYVDYDQYQNTVEPTLLKRLSEIKRMFKLKKVHTDASIAARALGRALAFKLPQQPINEIGMARPNFKWRVVPIEEEFITYDMFGDPIAYKPIIYFGKEMVQVTVSPRDAVLYVHKTDVFGNGWQGFPELLPIYNQLKWMANIERGWAEAMDARGISMLQVAIEGFELEDYDKWAAQYGNPSSFNVLFTDTNTKVQSIAGVSSTFNLEQTNDALTKDVASSSGMAMSRIDGTQRGQVTGSQTDTDNYYAILNSIQDEFSLNLVELHWKSAHDVFGKFTVAWDIEPKMDRQKRAQLFATNINSIQVGLDFLTYNQCLDMLQMQPVDGGDVPASVYIHTMHYENGMLDFQMNDGTGEEESEGDFDGEDDDDTLDKSETPIPTKEKDNGEDRKRQTKQPIKDEDGRARKDPVLKNPVQCKAQLASGRRCNNMTTRSSGLCHIHYKGARGGKWGSKQQQSEAALKRKSAIQMRKNGDSYRKINEILQTRFGSGISNSTISEINEELDSESPNTSYRTGNYAEIQVSRGSSLEINSPDAVDPVCLACVAENARIISKIESMEEKQKFLGQIYSKCLISHGACELKKVMYYETEKKSDNC